MTLPTEGAAALVARLRDGLSGVTPGPWVLDGHNLSAVLHCVTPKGHPDAKHLTGDYITVARCENTWRADAPFIAACSPDNIRALLDHIAAQEAALSALAGERDEARQIVRDIYWMALRYAEGRQTYAPSMCNDALRKAYDAGWLRHEHARDPAFARDGAAPEYRSLEARAITAEAQVVAMRERHSVLYDALRNLLATVKSMRNPQTIADVGLLILKFTPVLRQADAALASAETQEKVDGN